MDAVVTDAVGKPVVAIEIKSAQEIQQKHLKGLRSFADDYPDCKHLCVSLDKLTRVSDGIELLYVDDFLKQLWSERLF